MVYGGHYDIPVQFRHNSKLHKLLTLKYQFTNLPDNWTTLGSILENLKTSISRFKLFEIENPYVLLLTAGLEDALGVREVHVCQLQGYVYRHLQTIRGTISETDLLRYDWCASKDKPFFIPDWGSVNSWGAVYYYNYLQSLTHPLRLNDLVIPTPELLTFLRSFPGTRKTQQSFKYKTVCTRFSQYVLKHKERLIDLRNIRVLRIERDRLHKVFGVRYIYRHNIHSFLYFHCNKAKRQGRKIVYDA